MTTLNRKKLRNALLAWYRRSHRKLPWRETSDPYHIWVSEVMLQQTQVQTVIPYYKSFLTRYPTVDALSQARSDDVLKSWEGLGYYARARNLHAAAAVVVAQFGGRVPDDPESFRSLPGVGDYICAAVQSIAFGRALAVVDGNVKRVLARMTMIDEPVNHPKSYRVFKHHAEAFLDHADPGAFNQAVMELGATICRPTSPSCDDCPVSKFCGAKSAGRVSEFPVREKRRAVPEYRVAVGVVEHAGRLLITRRPESGLLGGLWEFPGGKLRDGEKPEAAVRREIAEEVGLEVSVGEHVTTVRHAYTHFKVELDVYRCRADGGDVVLDGPIDYRWITLDEIDEYAFPGANRKFIPLLSRTPTATDD